MDSYRLTQAESIREQRAAYRAANLEAIRAKGRHDSALYRQRHPETVAARKRADAAKFPERHMAAKLRHYYQLTLERYNSMLKEQDNACAICESPFDRATKGRTPHVDHDHATGAVRGILCNSCNAMLGRAGDNPATLLAAIAYLARPSPVA
jgi:hypothetical protein